MTDSDHRVSSWNLLASAGMTMQLVFVGDQVMESLSVWTGGTLTDVDDLTGATEHAGVLSDGGMTATVNLAVPTGPSVPLRLSVNEAVQTTGALHPSTLGAPNPPGPIPLSTVASTFELTVLGAVSGVAELAAHEADTTDVHGIVDTSALLDTGDVGTTVQAHSPVLDATTAPFTLADEAKLDGIDMASKADLVAGVVPDGQIPAEITRDAELAAGLDTKADLDDPRLSDARTPTAHAATHAATGDDPVALTIAQTTGLQGALDTKAPLVSPALDGTPTAPTPPAGDDSTKVATTAFVKGAVESVVRLPANQLSALLGAPTFGVLGAGGTTPVWLVDPTISNERIGASLILPESWASFSFRVLLANAGAGAGTLTLRASYAFTALGSTISLQPAQTTLAPDQTITIGTQYQLQEVIWPTPVTNQPGSLFSMRCQSMASGSFTANDFGIVAFEFRKAS